MTERPHVCLCICTCDAVSPHGMCTKQVLTCIDVCESVQGCVVIRACNACASRRAQRLECVRGCVYIWSTDTYTVCAVCKHGCVHAKVWLCVPVHPGGYACGLRVQLRPCGFVCTRRECERGWNPCAGTAESGARTCVRVFPEGPEASPGPGPRSQAERTHMLLIKSLEPLRGGSSPGLGQALVTPGAPCPAAGGLPKSEIKLTPESAWGPPGRGDQKGKGPGGEKGRGRPERFPLPSTLPTHPI